MKKILSEVRSRWTFDMAATERWIVSGCHDVKPTIAADDAQSWLPRVEIPQLSHLVRFGVLPGFPVGAAQELVGFVVVHHLLFRAIPGQCPAQFQGVVGEDAARG